jgi:hypothetical protein
MNDKTSGQPEPAVYEQLPPKKTSATDDAPVPSYGLLYITRAYNRREITLEEWMRLSRAWAEAMERQYGDKSYIIKTTKQGSNAG